MADIKEIEGFYTAECPKCGKNMTVVITDAKSDGINITYTSKLEGDDANIHKDCLSKPITGVSIGPIPKKEEGQ